MSREIKFRAWDKEQKSLLPVSNLCWGGGDTPLKVETSDNGSYREWVSTRFILEQYTGLKDKNGKEIYEGDIIKETIDDGSNKIIQMYEVYWDIDTLCWSIQGVKGFNYNLHDDLWQTNSSREVIGNIHENPELLEGEK